MALFTDEVKIKSIPHIDGLRLEHLIWFLENKCDDAVSYLQED